MCSSDLVIRSDHEGGPCFGLRDPECHLRKVWWRAIIVDEAHKVFNPDAINQCLFSQSWHMLSATFQHEHSLRKPHTSPYFGGSIARFNAEDIIEAPAPTTYAEVVEPTSEDRARYNLVLERLKLIRRDHSIGGFGVTLRSLMRRLVDATSVHAWAGVPDLPDTPLHGRTDIMRDEIGRAHV